MKEKLLNEIKKTEWTKTMDSNVESPLCSYSDTAHLLNRDTKLRYKISWATKFGWTKTITPDVNIDQKSQSPQR